MEHSPDHGPTDPEQFWADFYRAGRDDRGNTWSGRVNEAVARETKPLRPGTALELGCGEGADALWLAGRGWIVTAIDISTDALSRGTAEAERAGLSDRVTWVQADLAEWIPSAEYDLVVSAFMHSPVEFPREEVLRRAATAVAPGGRLLIVGHGPFPADTHHDAPPMPTADEVLTSLQLPDGWTVETQGNFPRTGAEANGDAVTHTDTVLLVRRAIPA